jgi:hypothetical protein
MALIRVIGRPSDGLVLVDVRHFGDVFTNQLWTRVKSRKRGTCAESEADYGSGSQVYRPASGSPSNRSQRILAQVMEARIKRELKDH